MKPFGGSWTDEKLGILRGYLEAYLRVMKNQRRFFRIEYIDAFAGAGYRRVRGKRSNASLFQPLIAEEVEEYRDGSAQIAVGLNPGFDAYIFIDRDRKHCEQLRHLRPAQPGAKVTPIHGDANRVLQEIAAQDWRSRRAVVFLDPYGMQVDWTTLEALASTKAIDLWLLVPLGVAPNRMLPVRLSQLDRNPGWRRRLDRFFGTSDWASHFYESAGSREARFGQASLFEAESGTPAEEGYKAIGIPEIASFFLGRLGAVFPRVAPEYRLLRNSRDQPLYMLCFATANPKPRAQEIALRIAGDLLREKPSGGTGRRSG